MQGEDADGDGLTYSEELRLGTDDNNPDTDADWIKDGIDAHPAGGGENYKFIVSQEHNGLPYTNEFGIPEDWYLYYKNKPRVGYDEWAEYVTDEDITIKIIAQDIADVSYSTRESCKWCIATDFVESMIYQYDINYIGLDDYPKYPIETIMDEKGDCEDTSFLMVSILEALNIDTVLFYLSNDCSAHLAVGVYCTWCSGQYYTYEGRQYYFLETTGKSGSWELGVIPNYYDEECGGSFTYHLATDLKSVIDV